MSIKDASAIILLKEEKVLIAQRNPAIKFLGGWHAFSGGKLDRADHEIDVRNCADEEHRKFIACAVRELFEEIGILIVRNGERLTKGQRASLHDDLISGRSSFKEILNDWGLWIDAGDFSYAGNWITPQFSPIRFNTRFFVANCPPKQQPYEAISEMRNIEFLHPGEALRLWEKSEILISPPVYISLKELNYPSGNGSADRLRDLSQRAEGGIDYVEINSRVIIFPLKTPTLPPATHTNCFIVGKKEFVVIDAASADIEEQAKLHKLIDRFIEEGNSCKGIIVSHLHSDHFGGEAALQNHLREKHGLHIPIATHKITAESLPQIDFAQFLEDNENIMLKDEAGKDFGLRVLHTPGHARGLLAFYDEEFGFLLSTDNVVGTGSVVIAPPEGDMKDYFKTLERLRDLPNLRFLCGSHGAAIYDAKGKIGEYIAHRSARERQVIEALESGLKNAEEIAARIYTDLDPKLFPLAIKSISAHLAKIEQDSLFES